MMNTHPADFTAEQIAQDPVLGFFSYAHLPEPLQTISSAFHTLAFFIVEALPRNAERTVALRKLLEAKDAGVRANIGVLPAANDTPYTRLVAELEQLGGRLEKLNAFIISPIFPTIDFDQRKLLQHQALIMANYFEILEKRKILLERQPAPPTDEPKIIGDDQSERPLDFKG